MKDDSEASSSSSVTDVMNSIIMREGCSLKNSMTAHKAGTKA